MLKVPGNIDDIQTRLTGEVLSEPKLLTTTCVPLAEIKTFLLTSHITCDLLAEVDFANQCIRFCSAPTLPAVPTSPASNNYSSYRWLSATSTNNTNTCKQWGRTHHRTLPSSSATIER